MFSTLRKPFRNFFFKNIDFRLQPLRQICATSLKLHFFGDFDSLCTLLLVQAELELSFSSDRATTDWLRFGPGHFKTKKDNAMEISACHPLCTYGQFSSVLATVANEQAIKRQRIAGRKIATDLLEGITTHLFFLRPRTMQDNTRIDNPSGMGINKTKLPEKAI